MNGSRFFLDTNARIALLAGNQHPEDLLSGADWIGTSVVCALKFLFFPQLSSHDKLLFEALLRRIEVTGISNELKALEAFASVRRESRLRLPDALIAGAALQPDAVLLTNDKHFQTVKNLKILHFV